MKWLWPMAASLGLMVGIFGAGGCASPGVRSPSSLHDGLLSLSEIVTSLLQSRGAISSRKLAGTASLSGEDFLSTQACDAFRMGLTETISVQDVKIVSSRRVASNGKQDLQFNQTYRIQNGGWEVAGLEENVVVQPGVCLARTKSIDSRDKTLTSRWKKYIARGGIPLDHGLKIPLQGCVSETDVSGPKIVSTDAWTAFYVENPFIEWIVCGGTELTVDKFRSITGIAFVSN